MKLLHTGDLHLGKLFYDKSLHEDQLHVLDFLCSHLNSEAAKGEAYDALLLCGDIYDRSIPPAESTQAFSQLLGRLRLENPQLHIFVISGNHDSALRLGYASDILEYQNIHIRTTTEQIAKPTVLTKTVEGKKHQLAVYQLPFLQGGSLQDQEGNSLNTQSALIAEAIRQINQTKTAGTASVLCGHLFTLGSLTSQSERTFLGTAEQVDAKLFEGFTYTALGHLHRAQEAGKNIWYAGSPLAYSFDEVSADKCFLQVVIPPDGTPKISKIPIQPLHPVLSLKGSFSDFYSGSQFEQYRNAYLELVLTDNEIVENPMGLLKARFPHLLAIRQEEALQNLSSANLAARREKLKGNNQDIVKDFTFFLEDIYEGETKEQQEARSAEIEAFMQLLNEVEQA